MTGSAYPVHVTGHLDREVSRWRWLVKWVLTIPHWVVLAFLWLAFAVLSVVAWIAILVTGRYPRAVFEFNVGVLRWSWRVSYYAYGALGTDRYPPFTLQDRPDYPASFDVDYPEHLSRGLALVKTWLLAIPHYLVLALFLGGSWYAAERGADSTAWSWVWSTGLIGLLVLVAGTVLLFTGRYPRPVFDLVLGLNRWALRVAAYAALMTDEYPPFRLDMGADEPGGVVTVPRGAPVDDVGASVGARPADRADIHPPAYEGWRVVGIVVAALVALFSLGSAGTGAVLAGADVMSRDASGFITSPTTTVASAGYAVTSERIDLTGAWPADIADDVTGQVRVSVTASEPLFVGVAPADDVDAYLAGVSHNVVNGVGEGSTSTAVIGVDPADPPAAQSFWTMSSVGPGRRTLTWDLDPGSWAMVVMNADGSAGVQAGVQVGAELPVVGRLAAALGVAGVVGLLLSGAALVVLLGPRRARG
jgi:hypothetical protein